MVVAIAVTTVNATIAGKIAFTGKNSKRVTSPEVALFVNDVVRWSGAQSVPGQRTILLSSAAGAEQ
jgi:hypothetical protein